MTDEDGVGAGTSDTKKNWRCVSKIVKISPSQGN